MTSNDVVGNIKISTCLISLFKYAFSTTLLVKPECVQTYFKTEKKIGFYMTSLFLLYLFTTREHYNISSPHPLQEVSLLHQANMKLSVAQMIPCPLAQLQVWLWNVHQKANMTQEPILYPIGRETRVLWNIVLGFPGQPNFWVLLSATLIA